MTAPASVWQLEGESALLVCGPLAGRVEVDGRGVRFHAATWREQPCDVFGALITAGPGPRPPLLQVAERYVRGADFVAQYQRTSEFPVAPHFYWRAKLHDKLSAVQIEMILSVQTDLLDSQPEVTVTSLALESRLFSAAELRAAAFSEYTSPAAITAEPSGEHLFVFRNELLQLSYAQLVHPSDFVAAEVQVEPAKPAIVATTLFPERLEKGVIRRGRICGWFLPAENDLEVATILARQFLQESPPLTA